MRIQHPNLAAAWLGRVLAVIWWGLLLILIITVFLTVAAPVLDFSDAQVELPAQVVINTAAVPISAPSLGITSARLSPLRGNVVAPAGTRTSLLAPALTIIVMMALALWVIAQLRALFRELSAGRTFAPRNAVRLHRIAWIVMAAEPLRAAMNYAASSFIASRFIADGLRFQSYWDFNVGTIFCAIVILAIAEVFRAGTRLDEDQSLTI